jgi:hypothetical protein
LTILSFVRKLRLKRFYKIGSSVSKVGKAIDRSFVSDYDSTSREEILSNPQSQAMVNEVILQVKTIEILVLERGVCYYYFLGSGTPCASPPPWPSIFSDYSFRVHHLVNRDDWQLLAHAIASDFSVARECLSKRIFFW